MSIELMNVNESLVKAAREAVERVTHERRRKTVRCVAEGMIAEYRLLAENYPDADAEIKPYFTKRIIELERGLQMMERLLR